MLIVKLHTLGSSLNSKYKIIKVCYVLEKSRLNFKKVGRSKAFRVIALYVCLKIWIFI